MENKMEEDKMNEIILVTFVLYVMAHEHCSRDEAIEKVAHHSALVEFFVSTSSSPKEDVQ